MSVRLKVHLIDTGYMAKLATKFQILGNSGIYKYMYYDMINDVSRIMRKSDFCLCENKGADQLCSNCEADQLLCFHYTDNTIPLLYKSKISSL